MPTPIKNITYLDGTFEQGPIVIKPRQMTILGLEGQALRQAPALWLPIRYATAQDLADQRVKVRPFSMAGLIWVIMTPFWRSGNGGRPKRGQLHPLTR